MDDHSHTLDLDKDWRPGKGLDPRTRRYKCRHCGFLSWKTPRSMRQLSTWGEPIGRQPTPEELRRTR